MSARGLCTSCKQIRWLGGKNRLCKPCAYPLGECARCGLKSKIYVNGFCYCCYQDQQVDFKLNEIRNNFKPATAYNQYLFELYWEFIHRHRLLYFHISQANKLKLFLEQNPIPSFISWVQIEEFSKKTDIGHLPGRKKGCAFIKIGYMLEEYNILTRREMELESQIYSLANTFNAKNIIEDYVLMLKKTNRSQTCVVNILNSLYQFESWLQKKGHLSLLSAHQNTAESFLLEKSHYQLILKYQLQAFYRWCKFNKHILVNPIEKISCSRTAQKHTIVSDQSLKKIFQFIHNPKSDAEYAFLLSLVLFWGLRTQELALLKLNIEQDHLELIVNRQPLTRGKLQYNREQIIKLPNQPTWFFELQKRFIHQWEKHFKKIKKSLNHQFLILPYHDHYNRGVHTDTVRKRFKKATYQATGMEIPICILRQTCGDLVKNKDDASRLSTLGWSSSTAFDYTWIPKIYFQEK